MTDSEQPTGSAAPEGDAGRPASGGESEAKAYAPPRTEALEAKAWRPSYVFLAVVTIVNLVLDLWSKHWAKTYFESVRPAGERRIVIFEDYLSLIFAKNRGGAWGLLQNETEALRRPFFLVVSVAAIVFIVSLYRKLNPGQRALKWGLPLVLGGALGNLIDRIRYGFVIDFIDVYMKVDGQVKHWPTFNVADIAICVGVALMAIDMFSPRKDKAKTATEKTALDAERSPSVGPDEPVDPPKGDAGPPAAPPAGEGDDSGRAAARGS